MVTFGTQIDHLIIAGDGIAGMKLKQEGGGCSKNVENLIVWSMYLMYERNLVLRFKMFC